MQPVSQLFPFRQGLKILPRHGADGQRYVLVAMVNHANAGAARPVLEALIDWTARQPSTAQKQQP